MKYCSGCVLPPTEDYIEDFFKKCHLVIEWPSALIEDEYNSKANEVLHHSSTAINDEKAEEDVHLNDCLRKFHEVEDLGSNDNIFCTKC